MNKITFPRKDVDGKLWSQQDIENWFIGKFHDEIKERLLNIVNIGNETDEKCLSFIKNNLKEILLWTPQKIQWNFIYVELFRIHLSNDYKNQIRKAFNYKGYREKGLIELAKILNVKCCPYCNMQYTLYAEERGKEVQKLAKFQFDHFYSKSKYPMLSMSLYNLIPSCSICNHSKLDNNKLSLSFHPYHSDISKQFKFELNNPINLYIGAKTNDLIDVNFIATDSDKQSDLDVFVKTFHLKALYQRHGDIARETFDKAYEYPYYSNQNNFNWLIDKSSDYLKRLWFGTYMNEDEIEKRPMTKFIQDLAEQAKYRHKTSKK